MRERLFADYAAAHRTLANRRCHAAGIPLVVLSLLGLLARLEVGRLGLLRLDAGLLLVMAAAIPALLLAPRLGTLFVLLALLLRWVGTGLPAALLLALQALGWGLQLLGHALFERRPPAFFRSLAHLIVGPLWLIQEGLHGLAGKAPSLSD